MGAKFLVGLSRLLARASKPLSIIGPSSQLMAHFLLENSKAQCLYVLELIQKTTLSH
jgi:hypothetical protein